MNKNTLLILLGSFVILSVIASSSWWGQYIGSGKQSSSPSDLKFSDFTPVIVDRISIEKKNEMGKVLVKEQGLWEINGFEASKKEIDEFLRILRELEVGALVSKNPENQKNFDVTEERGTILSFSHGGVTSSFIVGRHGNSPDSFYIRKKDSSNVYLASGPLAQKITQSILGWRDRAVATIPKDAVQKIEIASPNNTLIIARKDEKWQAESSGTTKILDDATTNRLFNALNPLEATDFLNAEEQREFSNTKDKTFISVLGKDSQKLSLISLYRKGGEWWGQNQGKDTYYKIPSYKLSDVMLSLEEHSVKTDG